MRYDHRVGISKEWQVLLLGGLVTTRAGQGSQEEGGGHAWLPTRVVATVGQ